MSLLMLGLQTNRQGQHYSEQSRDPPNSSLSLKQKSDHSSTALLVLNRALLYLCIAWSEQFMYTHLLTHSHIHMQTSLKGVCMCPCLLYFFFFLHIFFTFFFFFLVEFLFFHSDFYSLSFCFVTVKCTEFFKCEDLLLNWKCFVFLLVWVK